MKLVTSYGLPHKIRHQPRKKYSNKMFIKLYFTYYSKISTNMAQTHNFFLDEMASQSDNKIFFFQNLKDT